MFERHVCEPSGQHVPIQGPIDFEGVVTPETVNINCTFDAGYSFVGYTLDPLLLKEVRTPCPDRAHVFCKFVRCLASRSLYVRHFALCG